VPTPAVVAAAWYRTGPWYRADLVTELVPHARSLSAALFEADRTSVALDQLRMCGRFVKRLEAAGVRHADLNGMNILVSGPEDAISVHVLDLDRAHVGDAGRGGAAMRNRLRRSLRAVGGRSGRPLSGPEWQALDDGLRGEP
jgi:3-deoxy-D-manno-octulosonic acid kinase